MAMPIMSVVFGNYYGLQYYTGSDSDFYNRSLYL
jgi:hypothetical protein